MFQRKSDPIADAKIAAVKAPDADTPPTHPLEGRDVALFVDGRRVPVLDRGFGVTASGDLTVAFITTPRALEEEGEAAVLKAWGKYSSGDTVLVKRAGMPRSGVMMLTSVELPTRESDPVMFVGEALTVIHSMPDGKVLAKPGESLRVTSEDIGGKV